MKLVEAPTGPLTGTGWMTAGLKQPPFPRGGWCTQCGRGFSGDRAFTVHRVGPHGSRVCMTSQQMVKRGLHLNPHGLWGLPYRTDADA